MKLRLRLSLTVTAVTACVLGASFTSVFFLVQRDEMRDLDHSLAIQARTTAQLAMAGNPRHPVVEDGLAEVPESIDPTLRYIAVYSERGEIESATRSFAGEAPAAGTLGITTPLPWEGVPVNLRVRDKKLRGVVIPLANRQQVLLYATSRRTVDDDDVFLARLLAAMFLAATLATSLVAQWVGGRLARDVDSIANVARSVAQGDLDARVGGGVRGSAETQALAADLDHMIERLGALMSAQRTFISHAAHELRSPLAALRGELQLSLRRPRESSEYRETIEEALSDVDALGRLAVDLLTLARVEADASVEQTVAVGDAVADALRMARGLAEARGIALQEGPSGENERAMRVPGLRGEIARVLRNLVDNAVVHSPANGAVILDIARIGERARMTVTDGGAGVSAADEPHIFAPFYRGSKDQSEDIGAGLGLAIARGIARRHGGDISLDRGYTQGARFVLELPIDDGSSRPSRDTVDRATSMPPTS